MLHINDLTYRIEGRPILEGATAAIPSGHKVDFVGRNGAGKTTLLRLLKGEVGFPLRIYWFQLRLAQPPRTPAS